MHFQRILLPYPIGENSVPVNVGLIKVAVAAGEAVAAGVAVDVAVVDEAVKIYVNYNEEKCLKLIN